MRWLLVLTLIVLSSPAFATCGPDTAPSQAIAQGYTCETFRWVCGGGVAPCAAGTSGDDISEIDTGQTYGAPCANPGLSPCGGFKWYYNTTGTFTNDYPTTAADFTVLGNGKISIQKVTSGHGYGAFVLNTCGGPQSSPIYTTGTFFQNGFYAEFTGEWNQTGHPGEAAGFYGDDLQWYSPFPGGCPSFQCWEVDNPDVNANDQSTVYWGGGTSQGIPLVAGSHVTNAPSVETGTHRYGVMLTNSATTFWVNDSPNGTVDYTAFSGTFHASQINASKQCFGPAATTSYPVLLDSLKIWQAGPASPAVGGGRRLKH